jgi:PhoH-like ATPase
MTTKNFVLDTNVLLHDPRAYRKFGENRVVIPIHVFEEIDSFKTEMTERGRNAREVGRIFDDLREQGNLGDGIELDHGGHLKVAFIPDGMAERIDKKFLHSEEKDNFILAVALNLREEEPDRPCTLISKDTNLRVRADVLGLDAENYEEEGVSISELYPGACELKVSSEAINRLHRAGELELDPDGHQPKRSLTADLNPGGAMGQFYPNEYVLLRDDEGLGQTSLAKVPPDYRVDEETIRLRPLSTLDERAWGIEARNKEQAFALDALLDDDIELVTLVGKAGTGKTLLSIAAGLRKVTDEQIYQKLIVSRPVFPMGRDLGYLPGTLEEKLSPWMQPIFDNVEYLMGLSQADKRAGRGAQELKEMGIIEIEPLTYIRGRSIPDQFMIVDEAQNLTPHEVKTIMTRVGENTKIVLTGDPYQIDNPYIDSESNGLTHVVTRFKEQASAATVSLYQGERSELAELAADLL